MPGLGLGWGGGSHCLLSSLLSSGLLYLNDDFKGGDLFFTQPNALTVTVGGWAQLPGQDSKQKFSKGKCREMARATLTLSLPALLVLLATGPHSGLSAEVD